MIGTIARMYLYSKAPKAAFALLHPLQRARVAKTKWDLMHAYAPRLAAVGAVAVALPVGFMLGRVGRGARQREV